MLQDLRKSTQGTTAKIVVGLIAVTFALFGVESIVGGIGGEPEVAVVNGEDIVESEYMRALESKRRQILAQMGELADPDLIDDGFLQASVMDGLVAEKILMQDAVAKGLYISDGTIDNYIRSIEHFKVDGAFSNDRMQMLLRNAGLTLTGYRESLRKEFMIAQPRTALIVSSFVLPVERQEIIALDRQTRSFGSLVVSKADYFDSIVVSDDAVRSYYDANQQDFVKPESLDISYIELNKNDFLDSVELTDEELMRLYETEKQAFEGEEQRSAAHILLQINDDRSEEQAKTEIEALHQQLKAGAEFSELAKQHSEDEGSTSEGGQLGMAARGVYVADFEDALFALELDQVSQPVKTEFGYHLIKLEGIEESGAPSFEEVRASLSERLKAQKANESYAALAEQLADISYAAEGLEEPSEELGLELKQLLGVSKETQDPIFSNLKLQRKLFNEELIDGQNNSELIEPDEGHGLVFHIDNVHPEGVRSFDEVELQVRTLLEDKKATEFAESVGQAFVARVEAGEKPEQVAQDMGLTWMENDSVARNNVEFDRELLDKVFSADKEADRVFGFTSAVGNFTAVVLINVESGVGDELSATELSSIDKLIGNGYGAVNYRHYQQVLESRAEVTKL